MLRLGGGRTLRRRTSRECAGGICMVHLYTRLLLVSRCTHCEYPLSYIYTSSLSFFCSASAPPLFPAALSCIRIRF